MKHENSENLQAICNRLIEKRNLQANIARVKAQAEIDTIQRETDAYSEGVHDALRALQNASGGASDA